jgi:hypothetical protein
VSSEGISIDSERLANAQRTEPEDAISFMVGLTCELLTFSVCRRLTRRKTHRLHLIPAYNAMSPSGRANVKA